MKGKEIKSISLVIILLMSVIISSNISFATTVETDNEDSSSHVLKMNIDYGKTLKPTIFSKQSTPSFEATAAPGLTNIVVANEDFDEYHPSAVINGPNVLTAYERFDGNDSNVLMKYSSNYGQTWSDSYSWNPGENLSFISPALSLKPFSKKAFGTFVSTFNNSGELYVVDYDNINKVSSWVAYPIDWSDYGFYDFAKPDIATYPNDNYPWVVAAIGSTTYEDDETGEGPCVDTPMLCFISPATPSRYTVYWEPSFEGCSNISIGMDYEESQTVYGVCEINNGSNQDVLFFKGTPVGWDNDQELYNYTFEGPENLAHPEIVVKEDELYVAMETDANEENEIVMYKSTNGGEDWTVENITSDILTTEENPTFPRLLVNDSHLICSFMESGNLSYTTSNNSGLNWTEPYQLNSLNGSVVPGYHYSDIVDSQSFIWADNREGNNDIYFYLSRIPKIEVELIEISLSSDLHPLLTQNLINITVTNNGDALAKDVEINVTLEFKGGWNSTTPNYIYEIPYITPGQTVTLKRPLYRFKIPDFLFAFIDLAGIENISVTLDPEGKIDDTDRGNNQGKIEVGYDDFFPKIGHREDFFLLIKRILSGDF